MPDMSPGEDARELEDDRDEQELAMDDAIDQVPLAAKPPLRGEGRPEWRTCVTPLNGVCGIHQGFGCSTASRPMSCSSSEREGGSSEVSLREGRGRPPTETMVWIGGGKLAVRCGERRKTLYKASP